MTPLNKNEWMPTSESDQRILHERTLRLAKHEATEIEKSHLVTYIRFCLGREHYGIPFEYTKEVMRNSRPVKLPGVPRYIAGIINRRGALLAVLDLKALLNTQLSDYENVFIIVITVNGMTLGIMTDSIEGNDSYDPSQLDPPLSSKRTNKTDYILGLHAGKTAIINVESMISDPVLEIKN